MNTDSGLRKILRPLTLFLISPFAYPPRFDNYSVIFITLLIAFVTLNNMLKALFLL